MRGGQVSVEYLIIVGVALGLLIPAVIFFYSYSKSSDASAVSSQINDIGLQALSHVQSTYALGRNSRQTMEFNMPDVVQHVYVNGQELVFVYETELGRSEAVFFSTIPMITNDTIDGNISDVHPGLTNYRFDSFGSTVKITEAFT
ncbi:MAG: hypothetical protein OXR66_09540 [Candidatus Woesearchaeota archaeon]|nr:hypothetical protein [Candidatus Woesearchaeota archaeon]